KSLRSWPGSRATIPTSPVGSSSRTAPYDFRTAEVPGTRSRSDCVLYRACSRVHPASPARQSPLGLQLGRTRRRDRPSLRIADAECHWNLLARGRASPVDLRSGEGRRIPLDLDVDARRWAGCGILRTAKARPPARRLVEGVPGPRRAHPPLPSGDSGEAEHQPRPCYVPRLGDDIPLAPGLPCVA